MKSTYIIGGIALIINLIALFIAREQGDIPSVLAHGFVCIIITMWIIMIERERDR